MKRQSITILLSAAAVALAACGNPFMQDSKANRKIREQQKACAALADRRIAESNKSLRRYSEGWEWETGRFEPVAPDVAQQLQVHTEILSSAEKFLAEYATAMNTSDPQLLLLNLKNLRTLGNNRIKGAEHNSQELRSIVGTLDSNIQVANESYLQLVESSENRDCHPIRTEEINAALKANREYREKLTQERDTLQQQLGYREAALVEPIKALIKEYEERYLKLTGNPVPEVIQTSDAELRNELEVALAGAHLQIEIEEWGARATGPESVASKEKDRFLQFDSALLAYQKAKQEEVEYTKRLSALNMPADQKELVNSRLKFFRSSIDNALKELTEKGWQGQLEKQKAMVAGLQSLENQLSTECIKFVHAHRSLSQVAKTTQDFSALSSLYRQMIVGCNL